FHQDYVIETTLVPLPNFPPFLQIPPPLQPLLHISQIHHKHIPSPTQKLQPPQQLNLKILPIHQQNQTISLSIKPT
ncbi:S1 RNA-binding domain-containing protein, partial [Staphylococcus capitis]|uniref:S1 RNA-binding domain-containing protein n=1 Tax=Staphylococcus capitis TaxID=29388 RepID=UPI00119E8445